MNPIHPSQVVRGILDDRRREADQARLVALAKQRQPPRPRPRRTLVLFIGAALGATAHIAAATVSTLATVEVTGNALLSGMPPAAGVLGTALGSLFLPRLFIRWGLRAGLVLGYAIAFVGSVLLVGALAALSFPWLVVGMALTGIGNACNHLTRYAAADASPDHKKATALGTIVWAGTLGSIVGPLSLQPSSSIATALGRSELAGGFLVSAVFIGAVILLYLTALGSARPRQTHPVDRVKVTLSGMLRGPSTRHALTAMIGAQTVMVMIMTTTPLHIQHHGASLAIIGVAMMAHTTGMFGLAPLIGRIVDRRGATPIMMAGFAVLGGSAFAATLSPTASLFLAMVLFALGVGWSLAFVAGSSILATGAGESGTQVQGLGDSFTWLSGGAASIASGLIYQATEFRVVGLIGLLMVAATTLVLVWRWRPTTPGWADAR